ncbi:MAG: Crp/Fnr family transcriptional regulator [Sphaerobacteraceae bacterium]|nr:MAG: Crp/Fnr family transcriptional regulator [Sphaerobacteraceae bacterium]
MIEIFQDLSQPEMEHIDKVTTMISTPKGKVFYSPHQDDSEVLFLLKKGTVDLYRINSQGKKLVTANLQAGDVFGKMPILGQRLGESYAEATSESLVCVMSRNDVENLLLKNSKVAIRLAEALGNRLSEAESRLEDMAFKSVASRLASLLLRIAEDTDWRGRRVVKGLTHQQLAEIIGTYRETVTLTLNELQTTGTIQTGRRKVTLIDEVQLAEIADR